ncbi:formate dehydrogenase accessory sulfurtransferase FdhD [Microbacterium sp.]|uniref:formate dehydrogenase accessory sulfurtransferase FdhD n=1 Tax=Microbacterium sp. TaxID=51671 RepID=UPI003A846E53
MGRITARTPVVRIRLGESTSRRADVLAVEEPLEIRVGGVPLAVTMRTPGHDVELATGFLLSEGVISSGADVRGAIHCGGPGTGGADNTYNVLDLTLAPEVEPPAPNRNFYTTSSCGVCGKASIEAVQTVSAHPPTGDEVTVAAHVVAGLPDALRAEQAVFDKTGGLHAAALCTPAGELLVVREDIGRHNAVDKVVGWAAMNDRMPASGTMLQVSGRASFELVQKAVMAGIPILSAVSAPSSLAVELAREMGLTLAGFVRNGRMNVYSRPERIQEP